MELDACETAKTRMDGAYVEGGLAQEYSKWIFPQSAVVASAISYSASQFGAVHTTCQEN